MLKNQLGIMKIPGEIQSFKEILLILEDEDHSSLMEGICHDFVLRVPSFNRGGFQISRINRFGRENLSNNGVFFFRFFILVLGFLCTHKLLIYTHLTLCN